MADNLVISVRIDIAKLRAEVRALEGRRPDALNNSIDRLNHLLDRIDRTGRSLKEDDDDTSDVLLN